jgi:hypothetical protein
MFDEIANQKKSYGELGMGITAAFLMALTFLLLFGYLFLGLAINGYGSLPFIGWVDIQNSPQNSLTRKLLSFGFSAYFGFGLTQLIYVIPAVYLARANGWSDFAKSLIIGGSFVLLLNTACGSFLLISKMK